MTFGSNNQGLTVALLILIAFLVICNLAKLFADKSEVPTGKSGFQNTHPANNGIDYFPSKCGQTAITYCPGQHPKIPCDMVKSCPGTTNTLPPEVSEYVDSYVYLIALMNGLKNNVPGPKWWDPASNNNKGF